MVNPGARLPAKGQLVNACAVSSARLCPLGMPGLFFYFTEQAYLAIFHLPIIHALPLQFPATRVDVDDLAVCFLPHILSASIGTVR